MLDLHGLTDGVRLARDPPLLVGGAACEQKLVQLFQALHARNRHQMVAAEVAHFATTPPFSLPRAGLQNSVSKPQCERKAISRSVSSR